MLNIFEKAPYRWWQIWEIIKFYFGTLKCAWQRMTKGYCYRDVYDLSEFYIELFSASLKELSETTHGYPLDFKDMETWRDYLKEMAEHFLAASTDIQYMTQRVLNHENFSEDKAQELIKAVMNNDKYREEHLDKALNMFKERFYDLWD
jgi:hypothetical protein